MAYWLLPKGNKHKTSVATISTQSSDTSIVWKTQAEAECGKDIWAIYASDSNEKRKKQEGYKLVV